MTKKEMEERLSEAVMEFGRAIRRGGPFEYEADRLTNVILELIDTKQAIRLVYGSSPPQQPLDCQGNVIPPRK